MMKIPENLIRFKTETLSPYNIANFMKDIDVVTCLSLLHYWIAEYGVDGTKIMLRYIFGAKEIIIEQTYITYGQFVKWTNINDFSRREFSMNNPLVLHLMVKACIGFLPEFEILGETEYTQSNGKSYKRVIVRYIMDRDLNQITYHKNRQPNVIYKHNNRIFKYIPDILKRNADAKCNQLLGRKIHKHGDVFSIPYFKSITYNKQTKLKMLYDTICRLEKADIVHNEFFDNIIFTKDAAEPIDFELSTIFGDCSSFIHRLEGNNVNNLYHFLNLFYFKNQAVRFSGTYKINDIFKEYIKFLEKNDYYDFCEIWSEELPRIEDGISSWMTTKETEKLQELSFGKETYLEIGTFEGYSAKKISDVVNTVITIDISNNDKIQSIIKNNKNIHFLNGYSEEFVTNIKDESLDVLFIDGNHSMYNVLSDYIFYEPKVKQGGMIIFHDNKIRIEVTHVVNMIKKTRYKEQGSFESLVWFEKK